MPGQHNSMAISCCPCLAAEIMTFNSATQQMTMQRLQTELLQLLQEFNGNLFNNLLLLSRVPTMEASKALKAASPATTSACWRLATGQLFRMCMQERREIERALFNGELSAVAATNALELGVDVGSLDVTLHLGFPGLARMHGVAR